MKNRGMRYLLILLLTSSVFAFGHPFTYDLHLFSLPGNQTRTMICFHGYRDSYQIANSLKKKHHLDISLVSFNFPEHAQTKNYDPKTTSFGTIDELLPALYVLKKTVIDNKLEAVDLYGFSAGGGALINTIAVLNGTLYDAKLKKIGIGAEEKTTLLSAIQQGVIVLDTPLKSIEEIIDFRGSSEEFAILAKKYRDNDFVPIDSIAKLKDLSLNILLYFAQKDEILSNRDDSLYIERLQSCQQEGSVDVLIGDEEGHMTPHYSLWKAYLQKIYVLCCI